MTASRIPDLPNTRSTLKRRDSGASRDPGVRRSPERWDAMPIHAQAAALAGSPAGTVRIGPILALPAVLSERDVAPRRAFAKARVPLALFRNPESRMSFEALGRLLSACATLTGCEHFGLLVGERFTLSDLGAIGYLMRNSATVEEALRALLLHLYRYDRIAVPVLLRLEPSTALLGYSIARHDTPATPHILDASCTIAFALLRELCGASWKPIWVQLAYARPKDITPYRRLFGVRVQFDAELSGVVFAGTWLDHRIEGADPKLHGLLTRAIRSAHGDDPMSFAEEVECVAHQQLLSGTWTAGSLAHFFGIHERTLRARLQAERTSVQQILGRTRFELAQHLLQDTRLPLAEIAAALHYADPAVFSRAFRSWAKKSPRQWRADHATEESPGRQ
jgi:AraC-like DNA-binding protein